MLKSVPKYKEMTGNARWKLQGIKYTLLISIHRVYTNFLSFMFLASTIMKSVLFSGISETGWIYTNHSANLHPLVWNLISFLAEIEKYKENIKKIFQLLSRMKILFHLKKEPDKYGRLCKAAKLDNPVRTLFNSSQHWKDYIGWNGNSCLFNVGACGVRM